MLKIFDFKCDSCSHTFEKLVKDVDNVTCPKCNNHATKQMSTPQPIFKGSGFYHTDYKKKDPSYTSKRSFNPK